MNKKSLAALGLAGLMAASVAYVTPAMADDASTNVGMDQGVTVSPSDSMMQSNGSQSDNVGALPSDDTSAATSSDDNSTSNTTSGAATDQSSNDQGSPDTATGDDDY